MPFLTNLPENMQNELLDEIKLFYPNFSLMQSIKIEHSFDGNNCKITIKQEKTPQTPSAKDEKSHNHNIKDEKSHNHNPNTKDEKSMQKNYSFDFGGEKDKRTLKFFNKLCMYDALSDFTGKNMPWGSLTGIRPTKLAYDMIKCGASHEDILMRLRQDYRVSEKKAAIVAEIIANQDGYFVDKDQNILLYVHIPFCKTICSYCAFTAEPIARSKAIIADYTNALIDEIAQAKQLIKDMGKSVYSVYIGGGTPTSIESAELDGILAAIGDFGVEFTTEAGRPDTITREKLAIMRERGVNRLCVNPQTLNEKTLAAIGRSHSSDDFFAAYSDAKQMGFDINVDLIAGLPNEDFSDFRHSLEGVMSLEPDNITVHTLSIKNGAELKQANYDHDEGQSTQKMTDYALTRLREAGYHPYYLYRQKNMAENQENIGYAKKGKQCAYNITSMEEALPVLACGAGAISKILKSGGRIERFPNIRDPKLYIQTASEKRTQKQAFFLSKD